jgi:hypothetical protein
MMQSFASVAANKPIIIGKSCATIRTYAFVCDRQVIPTREFFQKITAQQVINALKMCVNRSDTGWLSLFRLREKKRGNNKGRY